MISQLGLGGAEGHVLDLAGDQVARGSQVGVLGLREGANKPAAYRQALEERGVSVFVPTTWWQRLRYSPGHYFWLIRGIRDFRPDVIHTHLPAADIAVSCLNNRFGRKVPLVGTLHGWEPRYANMLNRRLLGVAYRRFDALLSVSRWLKDVMVAIGAPEAAISVVYHGIDDANPDPESSKFIRAELLENFGSAERVIVGTVGRLAIQKGIDILIRALEFLPVNHCVVVVGADDGEGRRLANLAAELQVEERCQFVGFQANSCDWMGAFDVFAFPSRWEGFGLVLLEAGSVGVPVVATDISPVDEVIRDRVDGLLVPVEDPLSLASAVERLTSDQVLARRLSESFSMRVASEFSMQATLDRVNLAYEEVVSGGRATC